MRPRDAVGGEHLVEERTWIVISKETVFPSHLGRLWQCRQYTSRPHTAPINSFLGTDLKYFESLTNPQVTVALDVIHQSGGLRLLLVSGRDALADHGQRGAVENVGDRVTHFPHHDSRAAGLDVGAFVALTEAGLAGARKRGE